MAVAVRIPKLGLTMKRAVIASWTHAPGDKVVEGEIVLVIETDKVSFEVPAPAGGLFLPLAAVGEIHPVEATVAYIATDEKEYEELRQTRPFEIGRGEEEAASLEGMETTGAGEKAAGPAGPGGRIMASPLARRMAAEHGLDLASIRGTGPGGKIVQKDVMQALEEKAEKAAAVEEPAEREEEMVQDGKEIAQRIPLTGIRRVIFNNMHLSLSQSAQLSLHTEGSAEALTALRERLGRNGRKVSYNAILVKIAALALRAHPSLNASVKGEDICLWRQVNVGLAMEAAGALVVPVVRDADKKTIGEIDDEIEVLAEKARNNQLWPDHLAGGTFTVSNLGFADIDHFTPILRPPESAILGVGRIVPKAVVREGRVVPEARLGLSLTFDHRIIDGAPAARFLKTIKDMIEDPLRLVF
ncbi:MAG: dihydrolipoamide acetyltransferase family protein [Thermodesulfobacteriota bacterium]